MRRSEVGAGSTVASSDEMLLAACALGDGAAMGELFERHRESVCRFLSRLSSLPSWDLDDLVNATFLEAYRSAHHFRGRATGRTWLLGIALNIARHHLRGEARRCAFMKIWAHRGQPTGPQPDHEYEHRQLVQRIEAALGGLPHKLRAVLVKSDLEELSSTQVTETLAIPPGTLRRRLFEARRILRDVIAMDAS